MYLSKTVLKRQLMLNRSMRGYYIARIIQTIIFALIIGRFSNDNTAFGCIWLFMGSALHTATQVPPW